MPTPKQIESYHELFFAVCRSAVHTGHTVLRYPCADSAARARRRFYAFREAVYATPGYCPDLAVQLPAMMFNIDGTSLVLSMKGDISR